MKKCHMPVVAALALCMSASAAEVPVVRETDVVVVGGSSAAVSAALAAKEAGADVFLIAPRPYLGEDVAGTLRIARDPSDDARSPLFREFFNPALADRRGMPYVYTMDARPEKPHPDPKGVCLNDGKSGTPTHDSVQFNGDVTVTADLGAVKTISGVRLETYFRPNPPAGQLRGGSGYKTRAMRVSTSADGATWSAPVVTESAASVGTDRRILLVDVATACRYVRVVCEKGVEAPRQLLAELTILAAAESPTALAARTTPFHVKRALDRAMLAAGVSYLTGSLVCDVLKDDAGRFAGVVMANRSGRQIVRAKVLVDATPRARAARLAGGRTAAFPEGAYTFRRVVVAGEAPHGEGVAARPLTDAFPVAVKNHLKPDHPNAISARVWECTLDIPMKDGSARSFAAAEQIARDRTFVPTQVDAANSLVFLAPDHFLCRAAGTAWAGADALDLACLQPKDTAGVYVLGPLADVPRAVAAELTKPGAYLMVGSRVGRAAAAQAKSLPAATGALVAASAALPGASADAVAGGTVGEHHGQLPAYLVTARGAVSLPDALPVLADCDTIVVGAGTGGGPAGIAAARHGARTLVCEYLYVEGGVQTDGLIGYYYFGNRVGFTKEIDEGTRALGSVFPQAKSEWYRAEQRKAGAEIWFGSFVNGVFVRDGRVAGVVVVMEDGTRGLVTCRNAIDATGNAELPAMAGEETEFITDEELSVQGVGQAQNTMGVAYANSDIGFVDDTDAADVFYFALRSRLSLPENTWDQAQVINSRERRRMIGAFYMHSRDVVNERTYPDIITRTYSNFDSHGQTRDDLFFIQDPGHKPMYVNLPYRCLLPKTLNGLLVTGLGMSAHRDAMPILRMQPDIQNQGYAAGTAAAMAVNGGTTVRDIDVKALQRHLVEKAILKPEDLGMKDNFPLPDTTFDQAVADLADDYKGLPVLMTDASRALPRLQGAFHAAEGEAKFIYAHVLAMMGRPDGERQLLAKFSAMDWDKGWNYRGMGQFNRSVSWVDSYAIALG
ncbi:MAG: FAD-dependent oxidoreductase, partial [Kiritimatiellia bacterium]